MSTWLKWLLLGIVSVVFGIFALGNTVIASLAVATVVGWLLSATGIFQIIAGFGEESARSKWPLILIGALMLFLGISFLYNPLQGVITLSMLVAILIALAGVLRLSFAFNMRGTDYFWPMLLSGVLSILLAAYVIANFSTVSVTLLGILLGIELIFNGAGLIALAFFVRAEGKRIGAA